jgi:hypothetical protein
MNLLAPICLRFYIEPLYSKIISLINAFFYIDMKKDIIVSKIEAPQGGSNYILVAFTDPNALPAPSDLSAKINR